MDRKDFDKFYAENKRLVFGMARVCYAGFQERGVRMEFDDVIQELNIVFVKAFDLFDESRGLKFSTYFTSSAIHKFSSLAKAAYRHDFALYLEEVMKGDSDEDSDYEALLHGADSPEDELVAVADLEESLAAMSPVAAMVVKMMADVPEFIQREFDAAQIHAAVARDMDVPRRARAELDSSFIISVLEKTGELPIAVGRAVRRELDALATKHNG